MRPFGARLSEAKDTVANHPFAMFGGDGVGRHVTGGPVSEWVEVWPHRRWVGSEYTGNRALDCINTLLRPQVDLTKRCWHVIRRTLIAYEAIADLAWNSGLSGHLSTAYVTWLSPMLA